jgi:cyclase
MKKLIRTHLTSTLVALLAALGWSDGAAEDEYALDLATAPEAFLPPPIHPGGVELETRKLGPGVYALVSSRAPVDNSGFIVGDDGVLVIDSHINGAMAEKIQAAVRAVTDKPILYLVNTNYHGDHTFGNYAFPAETRIIAHEKTARAMRDFEHEKTLMIAASDGDERVVSGVRLRLPDITFDDEIVVGLGGRSVRIVHLGGGNTAGDTVVYEPQARVAWTGNLIVGVFIPPVFEGQPARYIETLARFARELDVETIVPGHGPLVDESVLQRHSTYLLELLASVRQAVQDGLSEEETLATLTLGEGYQPAQESELASFRPVLQGFHALAVRQTYRQLRADSGS